MLEDGKISVKQLQWLLFSTVFSTAVMFVPSLTAKVAEQDAWLSLLIPATLFGLLVGYICYTLGRRFSDKTIIQYSNDILGKYLGKVMGFLYILFFLQAGSGIIRSAGDFLATAFLPETPILVFSGVIVLLAASAVRNGIEVIARLNQIMMTMILIAFSISIVLVAKEFELSNLLPIFGQGIKKVMLSSLTPSVFRGQVMVLLMFIPYCAQPGQVNKAAYKAVLILGLLLTLDVFTNLAVFGPDIIKTRVFSTLTLVRYVSLGRFLERIEAVLMLLWVLGVFVKVSIFYYISVLAISQWSGLRDYKPIVLPVGVILLANSILFVKNPSEFAEFVAGASSLWEMVFELLFPAILLVIALIRRKGGQADEKNSLS